MKKIQHEEARPISALAKNAASMVLARHQAMLQAEMNQVASDVLESMGLSIKDGWVVDFGRGLAIRKNGGHLPV